MNRKDSGRHIFVRRNILTSLTDEVAADCVREVKDKLLNENNLTFDQEAMDILAVKFLWPELRVDCNGFTSESAFRDKYFFKNMHDQISSTKRHLLEDFHELILNSINYQAEAKESSFTFADDDDTLSGFTFAEDYEIPLLKYENYYDKKCPISDIIKVITELVRENPGQEAVYYLDKIDFYINPILKINHRSAFEFSLNKNFKSLQNDIWQVMNLGNDIIIFDLK